MTRTVKLALLGAILIAALAWIALQGGEFSQLGSRQKVVMVASAVEIEPIAQLREGFYDAIKASKSHNGVRFIERNAQGKDEQYAAIADEIARERPDAVYVLGTSLALAIQKRAPDVVIVQGGVTDPVYATLALSMSASGKRYAATSDLPPSASLVALIKRLFPARTRIGFLYNPSEPNSVAVLRDFRAAASAQGLRVVEFSVTSASEIPSAVTAAVAQSDILFVPPDNLVTAGLKSVVQSADNAGVPVIATTSEAVSDGATASVSTSYVELGRQAGDIMLSILFEGSDPSKMPIRLPENVTTVISASKAARFGLKSDKLTAPNTQIVK